MKLKRNMKIMVGTLSGPGFPAQHGAETGDPASAPLPQGPTYPTVSPPPPANQKWTCAEPLIVTGSGSYCFLSRNYICLPSITSTISHATVHGDDFDTGQLYLLKIRYARSFKFQ
jgi:hypothetical protein